VVQAIAAQSDGRVIIAGFFTTVNGVGRTNFARLNNDGSLDTSFDTGTNVFYAPIALQPDGKVLVRSAAGIVRLNTDGSQDISFNSGELIASQFMLQPDGKILVAGSPKSVVRLNANGSLDTSFDIGNGADNYVTCLALQADGRLVIGGEFASVDGFARNYVARIFGGDATVLNFQKLTNALVLSWTNAAFNLQTAPALTGPFTNLPAATSPYTNPVTAPQQFFRLAFP
jgi:uncharacterized delta-60 repeat protein